MIYNESIACVKYARILKAYIRTILLIMNLILSILTLTHIHVLFIESIVLKLKYVVLFFYGEYGLLEKDFFFSI